MLQPTVSVCMSVYNSAPYLREAVESILGQTFTDFEFLIIDDGSTDNSLTILQEYVARDVRIHLTSRANKGISKTRNEMLLQAQGEFIAVMDADDIALPNRFACQLEFLQQNPEIVCVGGAYDIVDNQGLFLSHVEFPAQDEEIQQRLLTGITALHHPCSMVRREVFLQVGGYDETMRASIDLDLWLRLGEVGKLANLKECVLHYRMHEKSVSERWHQKQSQDARAACERAWQRRGIQGTYEVSQAWRHPLALQYGWRMFNQGQRYQAMHYGLRAVRLLPFDFEGWRLLICSVIKPLPGGDN